jgi:DNA-binding LytR/AlgR family response regulator
MKVIIVDDDITSCSSLEYLCAKILSIEVVGVYNDAISAIQFLKNNKVDLILLDVEMPDFSGLDLVKTIPNLPYIIFTTGQKEYAADAFEYDVVDFITKPITLPRLSKSIDKVMKLQKSESMSFKESDFIFIKSEGRFVKLNIDDVLYIETLGDYVVFNLADQKRHIVYSSLKAMDQKLSNPLFVKVHRSFIVNISKIVDIEENNLVIESKVIPISRAHKQDLMLKINTIN